MIKVILQQFLWRQLQDSSFLRLEKSRINFCISVVKCGERAATLATTGDVRTVLENNFNIRNYMIFSDLPLLLRLLLSFYAFSLPLTLPKNISIDFLYRFLPHFHHGKPIAISYSPNDIALPRGRSARSWIFILAR